jgi:hypothetical protein
MPRLRLFFRIQGSMIFFFYEFEKITMTDTRKGKEVEDTHGEEEQHSLDDDTITDESDGMIFF